LSKSVTKERYSTSSTSDMLSAGTKHAALAASFACLMPLFSLASDAGAYPPHTRRPNRYCTGLYCTVYNCSVAYKEKRVKLKVR